MDLVFDNGFQQYYYKVRDKIFPQDKRGSNKFLNRAGDKLNEIDQVIPIFPKKSGITFLDICGGPGAFSQLLLDKTPKLQGYGITLEGADSLAWYKALLDHERFTVLHGMDGTGDIYVPENLQFVEEKIRQDGNLESLQICVSDGGFEIKKNEKGEHMENYQELFSGKIILSELLLTMKTLQPGGNFVCKLFDAFSCITQSVIFIATQVFEEVFIVKPLRSRIVNSEKYLVGRSLKRSENFEFLINILAALHVRCTNQASPISLIPKEILFSDAKFLKTATQASEDVCLKQTKALTMVMDCVDEEMTKDKARNK